MPPTFQKKYQQAFEHLAHIYHCSISYLFLWTSFRNWELDASNVNMLANFVPITEMSHKCSEEKHAPCIYVLWATSYCNFLNAHTCQAQSFYMQKTRGRDCTSKLNVSTALADNYFYLWTETAGKHSASRNHYWLAPEASGRYKRQPKQKPRSTNSNNNCIHQPLEYTSHGLLH